MPTIDKIAVELALRDAGFRAGMASSRGIILGFAQVAAAAARRVGQALETGLKVGAVGGAAGLGFAVKAAIDFESQLSAVRKTTGLAGRDLDRFAGRVKDLARALPGASVEDLMGAAAEGGRQGISNPDELAEYVKTIGMMKVALDDIPIEESANIVGKLTSNYGLAISSARGLASALNKLDDTSKASAREIMQAALQSSQMAHALGISADWSLALSSGLVEAGMSAETAGTAFSQILRRLSSEQETFAALAGVSAEQYAASLRQGPLAALELVIRRLQAVSAQQGGVAAIGDLVDAKVVDQQQTQALLSLVQTWDQLAARARQANVEMQTSASLLNEVEVSGNTTEKQLGLLWNQILLAGEAIGNNFLPGIKAAVKHLGSVADQFAKWAGGGAFEWIKQLGLDLADVFGGALKNWPGAMDLLGKLFDSLFARVGVGVQKIRASLLNALADFQAHAPLQWAGDPWQTRKDANLGKKAARIEQERADGELKKSWDQVLGQGRMSRMQIDAQRADTLASPQQPQQQGLPPQQAAMQQLLQQQQGQRQELLRVQEQQRVQLQGRGAPLRDQQVLSTQHEQEKRDLLKRQGQEQVDRVMQLQQQARQVAVPPAPKDEEKKKKERPPLPGPDAPERKFAREFKARISLDRIERSGNRGIPLPRDAAKMVQESNRKSARDELQRKLEDDLRREREGPEGKGPQGPAAFERMGKLMKGLEGIRWEKFTEARGEIGKEFMRDEAMRQEDRVAAMQERMFAVRSGSTDDFASAVQGGIGKSSGVQEEIRDFSRRQTELLDRIARAYDDVYLEGD